MIRYISILMFCVGILGQDGYLYEFQFNDDIFRVNSATSARTQISSVSYGTVYSGARSPISGIVYYFEEGSGAVSIFDPALSTLNGGSENCITNPGNCNFEINDGTGNPNMNYRLAFHPDGRLFGYSSSGGNARRVYLIDTSSGVATWFGTLSGTAVPTTGGDIAFNRTTITCGGGDPFASIAAGSMFIGVGDILYIVSAAQISGCSSPCTLNPAAINTNLPGSRNVTGLGFEYDNDLWIGEYQQDEMIRVNPCNANSALAAIALPGLTVELTSNIGLATTPTVLTSVEVRKNTVNWAAFSNAGNVGFNLLARFEDGTVKLNEKIVPVSRTDGHEVESFSFTAKRSLEKAKITIEAIDIYGGHEWHGPFTAGSHGKQPQLDTIDWQPIQNRLATFERQNQSDGFATRNDAVKLLVDETGIYRVDYFDLLNQGLNWTNVSIDQINLESSGVAIPIHIESTDARFGPGDYIEFVGESLESLYSDTNVYILRRDGVRLDVNRTGVVSGGTVLTTALVHEKHDEDAGYSFSSPFSDPWYKDALLTYSSPLVRSYPVSLPSVQTAYGMSVRVVGYGVTDYPEEPDHHLRIWFNNHLLDDIIWDGLETIDREYKVPASAIDTNNAIRLELPADLGVTADLFHLESIEAVYTKRIDANTSVFNVRSGKTYEIPNMGEVPVLYIQTPAGIVKVDAQISETKAARFTAPKAGDRAQMVAYMQRASDLKRPTLEPLSNPIQFNGKTDYLIISHPMFVDHLGPFVAAKQAQGYQVKVVDVDQVYDSYSYGIKDAAALQRLVATAYNQLGTSYVLLVGGDSYDYKGVLPNQSVSFVPTLYTRTHPVVHFTPSDPLIGDVTGNRVPDVAVGRFPVRSIEELEAIIQKTLQYEASIDDPVAIVSTDRRAPNGNFSGIGASLADLIPANWWVELADIDVLGVQNAHDLLIDTVNSGSRLTQYVGHSTFTSWSFEHLFRASDVATQLNNSGEPTGVIQWGCWNTYHVHPNYHTLGHRLLLEPDKGAAFVIGASTLTEISADEQLARLLVPLITNPNLTIGQAMLAAKKSASQVPGHEDVVLGTTLLGDPTVKVGKEL